MPDSREIRIDPATHTLIREGVPSIVNPYDLHGVEEAVRFKERFPGSRVTVISMGPPMAAAAVRECVALGADEGVLVSDRAFAGADTLATSYVLSQAVLKAVREWGPVDLVVCGKQTIDGDTGQVGPGLAARLGFEPLTYVEAIEDLDPQARRIRVRRRLEDGVQVVETRLPAVLTVLENINRVRRAPLPQVLRAVRYRPVVWSLQDFPDIDRGQIGLKGSPTVVGKAWVPEPVRRAGRRLDGSRPDEAARAAWDLLLESRRSRAVLPQAAPSGDGASPALVATPVAAGPQGAAPGDVGILVVVEQHDGRARPVSWQLLGQARRMAAKLPGCPVEALVMGHGVEEVAREAIAYGADVVYLADHPVLREYRTHPYTEVAVSVIRRCRPEIVLVGATYTGRDLAGAVATRLATGLTADCTMLDVEPPPSRLLLASRPAFSEKLMATILCKHRRPQMATARPGVFEALEPDPARTGEIRPVALDLDEARVAARVVRVERRDRAVRLDEARVIVAGGRGLGGPQGFALLQQLADALGGVVGASRRAVEAGWIGPEHQVGQTGHTVRPRLYVACGISGAVQHLVGMSGSGFVLAVDRDPEAPMLQAADVAIVGDLYQVVPALVREAKARRDELLQAVAGGGRA